MITRKKCIPYPCFYKIESSHTWLQAKHDFKNNMIRDIGKEYCNFILVFLNNEIWKSKAWLENGGPYEPVGRVRTGRCSPAVGTFSHKKYGHNWRMIMAVLLDPLLRPCKVLNELTRLLCLCKTVYIYTLPLYLNDK